MYFQIILKSHKNQKYLKQKCTIKLELLKTVTLIPYVGTLDFSPNVNIRRELQYILGYLMTIYNSIVE